MDKLAYEGDATAVKLPSPALVGDTLDFSFSGLKTSALNYINGLRQKGEEPNAADLTASYTKTIVDAIVNKTEKALVASGAKTLVLAGGVAANSHIRGALTALCEKKGVRFCRPRLSLCSDNAAMVAAAGYYEYLAGNFADTSLNASALDGI
jgi:N6-L-threonylcarbamoyladenine synthase